MLSCRVQVSISVTRLSVVAARDMTLEYNTEAFSPFCPPSRLASLSLACSPQSFNICLLEHRVYAVCAHPPRRLFKMAFTCVLYFDLRHFHSAVYDTWYLTCSCAIKDAVLTSWLWWSVHTCIYLENLRAALQISTKTVLAHENRLLYSDIDAECLLCSPAYALMVNIFIIIIIIIFFLQEEIRTLFSLRLKWLRMPVCPYSPLWWRVEVWCRVPMSSPSASAVGLKTNTSLLPASVSLFFWGQ